MLQQLLNTKQPKTQADGIEQARFDRYVRQGLRLPENEAITETWKITPELAGHILNTYHKFNRKLRPSVVDAYANDMKSGRWRFSGQGIIINADGGLDDGQHRLNAIISADTPVNMTVTVGTDPAAFHVMDTGRKRSPADALMIDGVKNSQSIASTVTMIIMINRGTPKPAPSSGEIMDELSRNEKTYQQAVALSQKIYAELKGSTTAYAAFCFLVLSRSKNRHKLADFISQIAHGENIRRGDPAFAIRHLIINRKIGGGNRYDRSSTINHLLKAWERYVVGDKIQAFRGLPSGMNILKVA